MCAWRGGITYGSRYLGGKAVPTYPHLGYKNTRSLKTAQGTKIYLKIPKTDRIPRMKPTSDIPWTEKHLPNQTRKRRRDCSFWLLSWPHGRYIRRTSGRENPHTSSAFGICVFPNTAGLEIQEHCKYATTRNHSIENSILLSQEHGSQ